MKIVCVKSKDGQPLFGEQLATFAEYVQGVQFRFIVVRFEGGTLSLTHRESGSRVAVLEPIGRTANDLIQCGRSAIKALVKKHGEARVRSVLAGA